MIMFVQISAFLDNIFSKYQCEFWKGYSTQRCNLSAREKGFGALLTDFRKIFELQAN